LRGAFGRGLRKAGVGCAVVASMTLGTLTARAHSVGLSRGEYRVAGSSVDVKLVFSGVELAATLPDVDSDRDGKISAVELASGVAILDTAIVQRLDLRMDGARCSGLMQGATLADSDAVRIGARFACSAGTQLSLDAGFLATFSSGHRHLATVLAGGGETSSVLVPARERLDVHLGRDSAGVPLRALVWLGMTHIWTGYDHLAFLFGLVLLGGSLRALVSAISAFTLAHSMTLGLAALHLLSIRPAFVEPAIALSVAYVGLENLWVRAPNRRWRVTFPFGLVHGFGFAGALTELDLPAAKIPVALFAFNAGVEVGQLAILSAALPLILHARRSERFRTWGVRALSLALGAMGLLWFAWRIT
jgi:hydrogenase/urease accessory protein HupE